VTEPVPLTASAGWHPCGDEGRLQFWDGVAWTGQWTDAGAVGRIRWRPRLRTAAWVTLCASLAVLLSGVVMVRMLASDRDPNPVLTDWVLLLALLVTVAGPFWLFFAAANLNRFAWGGGVSVWWLIGCIAMTIVMVALWWWSPAMYVWPALLYAGVVTTELGWSPGARVRNWSLAAPVLGLAGRPLGVLVQSGLFGSAVMAFLPALAELVASTYLIAAVKKADQRLNPLLAQRQ
jgi:hypothetical protein